MYNKEHTFVIRNTPKPLSVCLYVTWTVVSPEAGGGVHMQQSFRCLDGLVRAEETGAMDRSLH